jgi:hypothetical protein
MQQNGNKASQLLDVGQSQLTQWIDIELQCQKTQILLPMKDKNFWHIKNLFPILCSTVISSVIKNEVNIYSRKMDTTDQKD